MTLGTGAAAADDSDAVGGSFSIGSCTYTIVGLPDGSEPGSVRLTGIDQQASDVTVPSQVASPTSGAAYDVTELRFSAFDNHTTLASVTLPSSSTSILAGSNGAFFYGCSSLKSIEVAGSSDGGMLASSDGVLYARNDGKNATLLSYPRQRSAGHFTVPESVSTVAPYAFAQNASLEAVEFQDGLLGESDQSTSTIFRGGIGTSAFEDCSSLESVTFPENATIGTVLTSVSPAIGASAFKDCTSLASLVIPALMSADQKANAYESFAELNPGSNLSTGSDATFTSGYMPYWHNGNGPVARYGIADGAFAGCTALESVVFAPGNNKGAFAYWTRDSNLFTGCTALKSLVYEGKQAYWGNPGTSMQNGGFTDIWSSDYNAIDAPDLYYAVDYYATADDAESADSFGSTRLARVEYRRGTSTAAIATGDASLADQTAERSLYAQTESDGNVPDPDEAAHAAGLEGTGWAWKLDGTQARRGALSESCRAHLAKRNELSAGRIESTQTDALYLQADRNLSEGTALCPESPFDVTRYDSDSNYQMTPLAGDVSPYYTYNPTTGELDGSFQVVAVDGTALDSSAYTTSFQRYDASNARLVDASSITSGGAYLVTITATDGDHEGTLSEWILVQAREGNLVESFGATLSATEQAAKYPYSQTSSIDYSASPYSVTIGTKDVCGALVASSCAGLVSGAINVDTAQTAKKHGFELNRSTYPNGSVRDAGQTRTFARETSAPAFAVAVYEHFRDASNRSSYGIASAEYNLGDTAVLVPLGHVSDVASVSAYLYGAKAPVFFTELDGSCSKATRTALKSFAHVKVAGGTMLYPKAAFSKLQKQLGAGVSLERIGAEAQTPGAFSLAVADELVSAGDAAYTSASVSSAADPLDCVLALNFTGHEDGVTLVTGSTAQSRQIMSRLHENIGGLSLVQLYGRTKGNPAVVSSKAWTGNAFGAIWESDEEFQRALNGVVTTVKDAKFSTKAVDPDYEPAGKRGSDKSKTAGKKTKRHASGNTANGAAGASASNGASETVVPPDRQDPATNGSGQTSGSSKGKASAGGNAQPTQASLQQGQTETASAEPASGDDTPLWQKAVFIVVLLVLCGALIPILRKCR